MENDNFNTEELLVLYALGELTPEEVAFVEQELSKRPELMNKVNKIRRMDDKLTSAFAMTQLMLDKIAVEGSVKPYNESKHWLGHRMAFSVAALALIAVVGAVLYPLFINNDKSATLAMKDISSANPQMRLDVADDCKLNFFAPAVTEESVLKSESETPLEEDALLEEKQRVEERASISFEDNVNAGGATVVEEVPNAEESRNTEDALIAEKKLNAKICFDSENTPNAEEASKVGGVYSVRNAIFNVPSQKTTSGMAPIKGEAPPMKEELLPDSTYGEMVVDQMNKRLEIQKERKALNAAVYKKEMQNRNDLQTSDLDSYWVLRQRVLEQGRLPGPEEIKIDQLLVHFNLLTPQSVAKTDDKSESDNNKNIQFALAVNSFANLLSNPDLLNEKSLREISVLLSESVGDDVKRQEFQTIVERTIEIITKTK